jgi:response regulator NasT
MPNLRVLIADGDPALRDRLTGTVVQLGHDVIATTASLSNVAAVTAAERPDVAIMIVQEGSDESLEMIGRIVREAACPVIAVLDVQNKDFIRQAASKGIFAYLTGGEDPSALQSSIDIVLRRFSEYHDLEGAFGRRAVTERAKGVLMERHGVDEQGAFNMLREEARRTQRKVVDVADAVLASHRLLKKLEPSAGDDPR